MSHPTYISSTSHFYISLISIATKGDAYGKGFLYWKGHMYEKNRMFGAFILSPLGLRRGISNIQNKKSDSTFSLSKYFVAVRWRQFNFKWHYPLITIFSNSANTQVSRIKTLERPIHLFLYMKISKRSKSIQKFCDKIINRYVAYGNNW